MNIRYQHIIIILFGLCPLGLIAQLSPGKLSKAHSDLEGLSNCTQCHDLGNKVPDNKCLSCHEEIQSLITANRGFHAHEDVQIQNCTHCHSEHHGLKFDATRFDQENFDHELTGYELDGEHGILDCRACHTPENIADPEIRMRENTFLGLEHECLSCHDDFHQGTLSNNCIECHDFDAFRPATYFDHDEADFVLRGKHIDVACIECHAEEIRNGVTFQKFVDIEFSDCISCHDDPHNATIPGKCTQCHVESSFQTFKGQNIFNHNLTDFELRGSHASVNCFDCHTRDMSPEQIFQDHDGIIESDCISCHEDVHEGKFGVDCVSCHNEVSFLELKDMDVFDHDMTDYPLEGKHIGVDCKACHLTTSFTDPIDFAECKSCHEDYHNGEFIKDGISPDCIECHVLEEDFTYTTFGLEEHESTNFPLDGAHMATPCFECHISEEHWTFRDIGQACVDCHDDIHEGYISEQYYENDDCTVCHNTEMWSAISFDHDLTEWSLTGEHASADCASCHINRIEGQETFNQEFKGLSQQCFDCHDNPHGSQFEIEGITDCLRCHTSENWEPSSFNHDETAFPLEGKHAEVSCNACHTKEYEDNGVTRIDYTIESFECIDCHLQ